MLARLALLGAQGERGAPTRRASEKVGLNRTKINIDFCQKDKCKNFKELFLTQMAALVVLNLIPQIAQSGHQKSDEFVEYFFNIQKFI
ncbi:MAG: hypothetical protein N2691_03680 [Patescibacteria group bacterium]|nr:hypothetical protein [Patescibacteria group bacterium]